MKDPSLPSPTSKVSERPKPKGSNIQIVPINENQMEKNMENEMETEVLKGARYGSKYTNNTYMGP